MRGVDALELDDAEYRLTPDRDNWGILKSAVTASGGEHKEYDILGSDGKQVLEIRLVLEMEVETAGAFGHGSMDMDRGYVFASPEHGPVLTLDVSGTDGGSSGTTHVLREALTGKVLATWERHARLDWTISDPSGAPLGTVSRSRTDKLRDIVPFVPNVSFSITAPEGPEVARVVIRTFTHGLSGYDIEVTIAESTVPREIVLPFVFGLYYEIGPLAPRGM